MIFYGSCSGVAKGDSGLDLVFLLLGGTAELWSRYVHYVVILFTDFCTPTKSIVSLSYNPRKYLKFVPR
jgi:hypothetical protein